MSNWSFGPAHRDYGHGEKDWRPVPTTAYRPRSGARTGPARLNGRWSRAFDACQGCGKTDRKHAGHGYGFCCYFKNLDRIIALRGGE